MSDDLIKRIRGLKDAVAQERQRYALSQRLLYTRHPYARKTVPRYSGEEMQAREKDYAAQYRENTRNYQKEAEMLQREAWERLQRAKHFPVDRALTSIQRGEVAERLPIMRAEMAALDDDTIKQRLIAVASDPNVSVSERAAMFLAAGERRRTLAERRREALSQEDPTQQPASYEIETPLDEPLGELETLLVGDHRRRAVHDARVVYDEAYDVAEKLYLARTTGGKAKDAYDVYSHQQAEARRRDRERQQAEYEAQAEAAAALNGMDPAQRRRAIRAAAQQA